MTAHLFNHLHSKPVNPKRIVILGSNGFLGKKLTEKLTSNHLPVRGVQSSEIDLCLSEAIPALRSLLQPNDTVVFTAAITPDRGRGVEHFMKNLRMAEHFTAAVEGVPLSQVIYISSDAVFADDLPIITESTPSAPPTLYGLMHLAREKIVASTLEKNKTPYLILRPCPLYGAGDTHNSYGPNRFLRSAFKDKKIVIFGRGEEKRPHLYMEDFTAVLLEALVRCTSGLIHVVPWASISFRSVTNIIIQLIRNDVSVENIPGSNPITHRHFDSSNLMQAFPEMSFTPFEAGIQEFFSLLV